MFTNKIKSLSLIAIYILAMCSFSFTNKYTSRKYIYNKSDTSMPGKCDAFVFIKNDSSLSLAPKYNNNNEAIYWNSPTAEPGEHVLVKGNFSPNTREIELSLAHNAISLTQNLLKTVTLQVEQMGPTGFSFQVPDDFPIGSYQFRLKSNKNISSTLNIPKIYWMISKGEIISSKVFVAGDSILLFGINFPKKGNILISNSQIAKTIPFVSFDQKSTTIVLPADLIIGNFTLQIAGVNTVSSDFISLKIVDKIKINTTDIICSQLIPDSSSDNSTILQKYFDQYVDYKSNVIFTLPKGVFLIKKAIHLNPHEFLKGQGISKTKIIGYSEKDELTPYSWVSGTTDFGIEELSILAPLRLTLVGNFLNIRNLTPDSGVNKQNIYIRNVFLKCTNHLNRFGTGVLATSLIQLIGKNISIINSVLDNIERKEYYQAPKFTDNAALNLVPLDGCVIENNDFKLGDWGLGVYLKAYKNVFINSNYIEGMTQSPGAANGLSIWSTMENGNSENLFVTKNTFTNILANYREAITSDGGGGTYFGYVKSSTASLTYLENNPGWSTANKRLELNSFVAIVTSGTGIGQCSFIKSFSDNLIELSQPWKITPDSHSVISVFLPQNHIQIVGNIFKNTGFVQYYGSVINSEISDNTMINSFGIRLYSGQYFCSSQPVVNISITNNKMLEKTNDIFSKQTMDQSKKNIGLSVFSKAEGFISGVYIANNTLMLNGSLYMGGNPVRILPIYLEKNNTISKDLFSEFKNFNLEEFKGINLSHN